jgi:hypothetical protein
MKTSATIATMTVIAAVVYIEILIATKDAEEQIEDLKLKIPTSIPIAEDGEERNLATVALKVAKMHMMIVIVKATVEMLGMVEMLPAVLWIAIAILVSVMMILVVNAGEMKRIGTVVTEKNHS